MLRWFFALVLSLTAFAATIALAEDVIKTNIRQSTLDQRVDYKAALLSAILDRTVSDYGPYRVDTALERVHRNRALREMIRGTLFNTYVAPADPDWESSTIPIRIPIRRGLLNYRLLLTRKDRLEALGKVQTVEELKQFELGLRAQWTTTKVMQKLGFTVLKASSYDAMFEMLQHGRFDYIPRGVNEIYAELKVRQEAMPSLAIESNLALYIPMPVYLYVSPKTPRIAQRIKVGFERLIADGGFEVLFQEYFGAQVKAAKLHERRIIQVGNPLLSPETPLEKSELWFYPIERATGR